MTLTTARSAATAEPPASGVNAPSPAAFRAGLILSHMGDRRVPLTISDIAIHLNLAKSSVFNLLVSLEAARMVRRGEHGWVLSYRMLELSRSMLASSTMVAEFAHIPRALTTLHSETTLLAVLDGTDVIYLARNGGTQPVRFLAAVGSRAPGGVTGLGKAMLASLPDNDLDARLASLGALPLPTVRSHRTIEDLHADLMQIRERGYAIDDEQGVVGVTCVAVAFLAEGMPAAVSATLLAPRATAEMRSRLASELSILARGLSDQELP